MTGDEKRRHKRVKVYKTVTYRDSAGEHTAELGDISSSGAAINAGEPDVILEINQELELETEDFGNLPGTVVRTFEKGFALQFHLSEDSEDRLNRDISEYDTE